MGRLDGRLVCAECCKELSIVESGVRVRFGGHGVFYADIKGCPTGCTRVITGWAENPSDEGGSMKPDYEVL